MDKDKRMTKRELMIYRNLLYGSGFFWGIFGGIVISRHIDTESTWRFGFVAIAIIILLIALYFLENKLVRLVEESE
jgi:hypothetical protein